MAGDRAGKPTEGNDRMGDGRITTHALDTVAGTPAAALRIDLYSVDGDSRSLIASTTTNSDGRTDGPILAGADFRPGSYEIVFHIGAYLEARGFGARSGMFLDQVPVRFGIADATQHYHVPLQFSPYSYSTYRGS